PRGGDAQDDTHPPRSPGDLRRGTDVQREAARLLLARYAPVGVLINGDLEVLQVRGHTGSYLEPAPGQASVNLLRMAREGLPPILKSAVQKVGKTGRPLRRNRIPYMHEGARRFVNLEVIPLTLAGRG